MTKEVKRTEYGDRLFKARTYAKLTQPALAKEVGMGQSSLAGLERSGKGSSKTLQIASACGVSAEWLATGNGPMVVAPGTLPPEVAEVAGAVAMLPDKLRGDVLQGIRNLLNLARGAEHQQNGLGEPLTGEHMDAQQRTVKRIKAG